jgi:hypothetical protein
MTTSPFSRYISKGTRVRASWLEARLACLAGVQAKLGADPVSLVGTVRHIRSDHPDRPVNTTLFVDVEEGAGYEPHLQHCEKCGKDHVEVKPAHVVDVLDSVSPPAPAVPDGGGSGDGV